MRKMKFIFTILVLVVVSKENLADEECNEDNFKKCLSTVEGIVVRQMKAIKKAEKDLSSYCQALAKEGQCLTGLLQSCEDKLPKISSLVSTFHMYLNQFCGANAKMYMDIVPCFETHKSAFEKCWSHGRRKREEDHLQEICEEAEAMKCVAELSKEKCKSGQEFGTALKAHADKLRSDVCSGVEYLANSFWIIAATTLSVILMRNKLQ